VDESKYWKRSNLPLFVLFLLAVASVFAAFSFDGLPLAGRDEGFEFEWLIRPTNLDSSGGEGRTWVEEKRGSGMWTLYDESWTVLKDNFKAKDILDYEQGLAHYEIKWPVHGFLDLSGDVVGPPMDYGGTPFHGDGLILKRTKNQLYGFVNLSGEWVVPPEYEDALKFVDGFAHVRKNKKEGVIDKKGNWAIPPEYDKISGHSGGFSDGLINVKKDGKWGYFDENGKKVIDFMFDEAEEFVGGSAIVRLNSLYGLIDKSGDFIVEPVYEGFVRPKHESPDLIAVAKEGKMGFIDRNGNVVIDFKYMYFKQSLPGISTPIWANTFAKGRAVVVLDEPEYRSIGVIDEAGNMVFRIDGVRRFMDFSKGDFLTLRTKQDGYCVYDRDGRKYNLSGYLKSYKNYYMRNVRNNIFVITDVDNKKAGYFRLRINPKEEDGGSEGERRN
jgi:hypothetical protein